MRARVTMFAIVSSVAPLLACGSSEDPRTTAESSDVANDQLTAELLSRSCEQHAVHLGLRPVAPLSGATVTTNRPTLRWSVPARRGSGRVHVDLCRDRACTTTIASFDAHGDRARLPRALPDGVVFWRVRPIEGKTYGDASATWEFFVRPHTRVDSSFGAAFDPNGDGVADVAATSASHGIVFVFDGAPGKLATTPSREVDLSVYGPLVAIANGGDLNGDGFVDLLVASRTELRVLPGSPEGIATTPSSVTIPLASASFGEPHAFAGIGDFDGDGYADIVVADRPNERALVYRGSIRGLDANPDVVIRSPERQPVAFGAAVAGAGDVDGDGLGDVLVGAPSAGAGHAYLVFGGTRTGAIARTLEAPDTSTSEFGFDVAGAGDVDGDGLADVIVGAPGSANGPGEATGRAYVFRGRRGHAPAAAPIALVPSTFFGMKRFGLRVGSAGDMTGDALSEVAVRGVFPTPEAGDVGAFALYPGTPSGTSTTGVLVRDDFAGGRFAEVFASPGDVDADGSDDFVVGARTSPTSLGGSVFGAGRVYVFGGTATLPTTPRITFAGEDFGVRGLGAAVE